MNTRWAPEIPTKTFTPIAFTKGSPIHITKKDIIVSQICWYIQYEEELDVAMSTVAKIDDHVYLGDKSVIG
jgi:hypothetical protein